MASQDAPAAPSKEHRKYFVPLENNPQVFTALAHDLGMSPSLVFHDVYSLTDPDLLSIVKPEQVDDAKAMFLAKDIAKKIEAELEYPGQIKVNVIREFRSVEYAK